MTPLSQTDFKDYLPELKGLIRNLVSIESPSLEKKAVDRLGQYLAGEFTPLNADVHIHLHPLAGDALQVDWGMGPGGILILCHMDTVFELGTLTNRPYHEENGIITGPGVLDMKSSIGILLIVLRLLKRQSLWPSRPITILLTADEETGSLTSRDIIENRASQAEVVFCLEPAMQNGGVKTARKGTGEIELRVKGKAAHAGVDHEKGRNAIEELSHHILSAQRLTNYEEGTTVNVGWAQGGTRPNVVPDRASAVLDFRIASMDGLARLVEWTNHLSPIIAGTEIEADLKLNRPPMPRDATMIKTFNKARAIAATLRIELTEGSTGGGSDANFVAPLGIPVLDGLGPVGEGAHSEREFVREDSLIERAALLANLLLQW